ncbi:MAG: hypothetical protein Q7W02_12915 [Candidatus Rokubacteria bacterium]|nr:hypothetical protein [Candidatus Rokubacteria bacterium]
MTRFKTARAMTMVAVVVVVALVFLPAIPGTASSLPSSPSTPPPVPDDLSTPAQIRTAIEALRKGDAGTAERVARQFVTAQPGNDLGHEVLGAAVALTRNFAGADEAWRVLEAFR